MDMDILYGNNTVHIILSDCLYTFLKAETQYTILMQTKKWKGSNIILF